MRVLLIQSHALLRESLKELISRWDPTADIDDFKSQSDVRLSSSTSQYDLVILGIQNCQSTNYSYISNIRDVLPESRIVCFTEAYDQKLFDRLVSMGCHGVITPPVSSSEFLAVVQLVLAGGVFVPSIDIQDDDNKQPARVHKYYASKSINSSTELEFSTEFELSKRQKEVLEHLYNGKSNKAISSIMGISINTVKSHLTTIFKILDVRTRTEAVVLLNQIT